jgi:hypothetical protein
MSLGNNRDYKTRDRFARRNMAVVKARTEELTFQGVENAAFQAMNELKDGTLAKQLRAWVDPIQAHHRAMKIKNNSGL